jgi:VRR-NUC domain
MSEMRPDLRAVPTVLATEADYTRTIVEAAKLGGWLVCHFRPGRTAHGWGTHLQGHKGFPDLVLVHPVVGRSLFLELKRRPNRPTTEQSSWLLALTLADLDARLVYVPDDLDALVAELVTPQRTEENR